MQYDIVTFVSTWQNVSENDQNKRRKRKQLFQKHLILLKVSFDKYNIIYYYEINVFKKYLKYKNNLKKVLDL